MQKLLNILSYAADSYISIKEMVVPYDVYVDLCKEGDWKDAAPVPVTVYNEDRSLNFVTKVFPLENPATNRRLS